MNKAVLMSIQPKWCELIASGKKTIEVRKTRPKLDVPFKVYIYCTKGKLALLRDDGDAEEKYKYEVWEYAEFHQSFGKKILGGKVIGEFVCDEIICLGNISTDPWCHLLGDVHERYKRLVNEQAYLTESELLAYGGKYAWHISNLIIHDKPKELAEFIKLGALSYDDWLYGIYNGTECYENYLMQFKLKRPPQSWCYVKEQEC